MLRPSALVLALLLSSRAWWAALNDRTSIVTALIWFLVAVPVAGLMLAGLRALTSSYQRGSDKSTAPKPEL